MLVVKEILEEKGLSNSLYLGHSFRIGVATSAAHDGFEDSTIKTLGCWSCKAFLAYL